MKKFFILSICALATLSANAKFKFKSIDNNDDKTTIVIVDDNFKSGSEICCAKFNNDGKTYDAKSMVTTQEDGKMSITMTFKKMKVFNNMSITIMVNGEQKTIPIDISEVITQLPGFKTPPAKP